MKTLFTCRKSLYILPAIFLAVYYPNFLINQHSCQELVSSMNSQITMDKVQSSFVQQAFSFCAAGAVENGALYQVKIQEPCAEQGKFIAPSQEA